MRRAEDAIAGNYPEDTSDRVNISKLPMSKKDQKNLRGQPEMWGELKKSVMMTLTPTSISGLDALAHNLGLWHSELVERIGRGVINSAPEELSL